MGLRPSQRWLTRLEPILSSRALSGVVDYAALFMAKHDFSASQVQMAAGDQARFPNQVMVDHGAGGTESNQLDWSGPNAYGLRPAPLAGGNIPVRSLSHQGNSLLHPLLGRAQQEQLISESDGTQVLGDGTFPLPSDLHQSGSQSTSPFQISNSLTPIQIMAGMQFQFSQDSGPRPGRGMVNLTPASQVSRDRTNAQIFKGANESQIPQSSLQF